MRIPKSLLVVIGALAIVFVGMYALTQGRGANLGEMNRDGNNRGQIMSEGDLAAREPANIGDIRDAIESTMIAVDRGHWDEANHAVQQIRQRWLSFKPGMRAGAGVQMWPPTDVNQFESALAEAEGAISRQDAGRAKDALGELSDLAERHTDTRGGPLAND